MDWLNRESDILLNPRTDREATNRAKALLPTEGAFSGHVWLATSGSTATTASEVKYVALAKEALLASAAAVNAHLGVSASDVWINPLPAFHVGGLGVMARSFLSGMKVVAFEDKWQAESYHATMIEKKGTLSALVPTQIYDIVTAQLPSPPHLRAVVIGGGQLPEALYFKAKALGWPLLPSYGMTETASQIATASLDYEGEGFPPLKLLPHIDVQCSQDDYFRVKGRSLLSSYAYISEEGCRLHDPKELGWFTTEDKGALSHDELIIWGRGSNFVKISGESVSLSKLEAVLATLTLQLGCRQDIALLAWPDERLGHRIVLAIAGEKSPEVDAIVTAFQGRVLPFERIREVHSLPSLPRSPLGKLLRHEIHFS